MFFFLFLTFLKWFENTLWVNIRPVWVEKFNFHMKRQISRQQCWFHKQKFTNFLRKNSWFYQCNIQSSNNYRIFPFKNIWPKSYLTEVPNFRQNLSFIKLLSLNFVVRILYIDSDVLLLTKHTNSQQFRRNDNCSKSVLSFFSFARFFWRLT